MFLPVCVDNFALQTRIIAIMTITLAPRTLRALRSIPRKERRTMAWALVGHIAERHLTPLQLMTLAVLRHYQRQASAAI